QHMANRILINHWQRDEAVPPKRGNRWFDEYAHDVCNALQPFKPHRVECYADEGFPWVAVYFGDVVQPAVVVPIGRALQRVLRPRKVLFHALRAESIWYLIQERGPRYFAGPLAPELPATDYGVPLDRLTGGWILGRVSRSHPGGVRKSR